MDDVSPVFNALSPYTTKGLTACFDKLVKMGITSGHYLEFGLYQGYSLIHAYRQICKYRLDGMHLFGFDSFSGLPKPSDGDEFDSVAGQFAADYESVVQNLRSCGVNMKHVTLISGYYHDTLDHELLNKLDIKEAALVLIDCDLYSSAERALSFITPILREKTIILFDDWNIYNGDPTKGERRAFSESLTKNPHFFATKYVSFGWHGQSFILYKR